MQNNHYQGQLEYLRGMGREFAKIHPGTAGLLGERGSDPDVERLLQGFAFLCGRIHERFDAAVPQVIQQLCALTAPHQLAPRPATTIVEFTPDVDGARAIRSVPRGTRIDARAIDGTRCQFNTCHDVDVLPITLPNARYELMGKNRSRLTLTLRGSEAGLGLCARPDGLRIFLHGERDFVEDLRYALTACLTQIRVETPATGQVQTLPKDSVVGSGFDSLNGVLPWPEVSPRSLQCMAEWFEVPENFHFLDVRQLEGLDATGEEIRIVFELRGAPQFSCPPNEENFRLHCTPVVNCFSTNAEPLSVDATRPRGLLRAAGINARHMQIQSITNVVGLKRGERQRRNYYPVHRPPNADTHATEVDTVSSPDSHGFYVAHRRPCVLDGGVEVTLEVVSPPGSVGQALARETLSIEIECTNRDLPRQLNRGDLQTSASESKVGTACTNITRVRPPTLPSFNGNEAWQWMRFLSLGRRGKLSTQGLQLWLELLDQRAQETSVQASDNRRRRAAVRALTRSPSTRIWRGAACHGITSTVEVDESALGGIGSSHLFGQVLDHCLSAMTPLNQLHDTNIRLHPSGQLVPCPSVCDRLSRASHD